MSTNVELFDVICCNYLFFVYEIQKVQKTIDCVVIKELDHLFKGQISAWALLDLKVFKANSTSDFNI